MSKPDRPKLSEALRQTPRITPQMSGDEEPRRGHGVGANAQVPPRGARAGTRQVSIYLGPKAWQQLSKLKIDRETTLQELGVEALDLLFQKYGLNRIASMGD